MDAIFIVGLVILGAIVVIGGIVAYFALRKAPDGFEDEEGFHSTKEPKDNGG